jgi:beta-lactamase class A
MLALLGATGDGTKLLAPLPDDVQVEHKSGWYDGVANDVAVVHAPAGTYVLAVFTSGAASQDEANQIISDISELVYQAWGE